MRDEPPRHQGRDDGGAENDPKSGAGQITFLTGKLRHEDFKAALQVGDFGAALIGLPQGEVVFVWHTARIGRIWLVKSQLFRNGLTAGVAHQLGY